MSPSGLRVFAGFAHMTPKALWSRVRKQFGLKMPATEPEMIPADTVGAAVKVHRAYGVYATGRNQLRQCAVMIWFTRYLT